MKLINYTTGMFAGTFFLAGYILFQPVSDVDADTVTIQGIAVHHQGQQSQESDENQIELDQENETIDDHAGRHAAHELDVKIFTTPQERRDLFARLGIKYLESNDFDYQAGKDVQAKLTEKYQSDAAAHDDLSLVYQDDIQARKLVPMSVRWLGADIGYGIFAEQNLYKDDFVGIYTGFVQDRSNVESTDYTWFYPSMTEDSQPASLDALAQGNELRFANDGIDPNCRVEYIIGKDGLWHVCYVASKDVKKGDQLLISYGPAYWNTRAYKYQELADQK